MTPQAEALHVKSSVDAAAILISRMLVNERVGICKSLLKMYMEALS
jgi:hypothetical protein